MYTWASEMSILGHRTISNRLLSHLEEILDAVNIGGPNDVIMLKEYFFNENGGASTIFEDWLSVNSRTENLLGRFEDEMSPGSFLGKLCPAKKRKKDLDFLIHLIDTVWNEYLGAKKYVKDADESRIAVTVSFDILHGIIEGAWEPQVGDTRSDLSNAVGEVVVRLRILLETLSRIPRKVMLP